MPQLVNLVFNVYKLKPLSFFHYSSAMVFLTSLQRSQNILFYFKESSINFLHCSPVRYSMKNGLKYRADLKLVRISNFDNTC